MLPLARGIEPGGISMPYLIPSRAPIAPEEVDRAFDYLLALQTGGGNNASGRTPATPELAFLVLRLA